MGASARPLHRTSEWRLHKTLRWRLHRVPPEAFVHLSALLCFGEFVCERGCLSLGLVTARCAYLSDVSTTHAFHVAGRELSGKGRFQRPPRCIAHDSWQDTRKNSCLRGYQTTPKTTTQEQSTTANNPKHTSHPLYPHTPHPCAGPSGSLPSSRHLARRLPRRCPPAHPCATTPTPYG